MKTEDIAKLPPELRSAWKWLATPEPVHKINVAIAIEHLRKVLTYCLQMQEERERLRKLFVEKNAECEGMIRAFKFAEDADTEMIAKLEATIATLTRELDKAQDLLADSISREDDVRKELSFARKKFAALSHTPEGGTLNSDKSVPETMEPSSWCKR